MIVSKLIYRITESRPDGQITSLLDTDDGFIALADIMMKSKKPLGKKTSTNINTSETRISIWQPSSSIYEPEIIDIEMVIIDVASNTNILKIRLSTFFANKEYVCSLHSSSDPYYKSKAYEKTINRIGNKVRDWTKSDMEVAKVLAVYAARDPEHIFWEMDRNLSKALSLSM